MFQKFTITRHNYILLIMVFNRLFFATVIIAVRHSLVKAGGNGLLNTRCNVRIYVERGGNGGMTKSLLYNTGVCALLEQDCGVSVAEVMKPDTP